MIWIVEMDSCLQSVLGATDPDTSSIGAAATAFRQYGIRSRRSFRVKSTYDDFLGSRRAASTASHESNVQSA